MKKIILLLLCSLFCFANFAKDVPPALFVLEDPDRRTSKKIPLSITDFESEVKIHGDLALTEITLTFRNHTHRNLEGEFYYPLPANSAITGYALDIDGKMIDGVAVEKERATQVFEAIKARNIDPGLVEWESRDCFKTRVFPIFPENTRTIRVQYLTEIKNNRYVLPLKFKKKIDRFRFKTVIYKPYPEGIRFEGRDDLLFKNEDGRSVAEFAEENKIPENDIVIILPEKEKEKTIITETQHKGTLYFKIDDYPEIPEMSPILPKKVNIFWDVSGSRAGDRHDLELNLLKDFFARFADRSVDVHLTLIRHKAGNLTNFRIKNGDCKKLLTLLAGVEYGGGSQLIYFQTEPADLNLLFSDGNSTFGTKANLVLESPVYAFSSGKKANAPYLEKLAAQTGGAYFDLLRKGNVAEKIGVPTLNFISIEKSTSLVDTWPAVPTRVTEKFSLTGKMMGDKAKIKINYGTGKKILLSSEFEITKKDAASADILPKYRAMKELDELMIYPNRNRSKILKLGKKHGLVTPYTSLLVLERIDQYVEFRIIPPESEKQMRNEYFRKTGTARNPRMRLQKRMSSVTQAWKNRIMWWNTEFKYKPRFKYKKFRYYTDDYYDSSDDFGGGDFFDTEETFSSGSRSTTNEFTIRNALIARIAPAAGDDSFFGDDDEFEPEKIDPSKVETVNVRISQKSKPYLNALYNTDDTNRVSLYWKLRRKYSDSPAFFLDCADFFHTKGDTDFAIQVLSEIAEFDMENAVLQRIIACKLEQMGKLKMAIEILENAMRIYPENPDIQLELAFLYIKIAESSKTVRGNDYRKAFKLFYGLVINDDVDEDIAGLALMEINHMLPKAKKAGIKDLELPLELTQSIEADLRIVISRFALMEQMNFCIVEPSGEKVYRNHPLSLIGGFMSGGVGPEEYFVRKAMKGRYKIKTNVQGDPIEKLLGSVILKIDIYTNYGRSSEKHSSALVHMKKSNKDVVIGEVKIK